MRSVTRRVVYVALYEAIAILVNSFGLSAGSGSGLAMASVAAVSASAIAVTWNFLYNTGFEALEARFGAHGRSLPHRIGHAVGFEAGMMIVLAPLFMWLLHISFVRAVLLNLGMSAFFLVYTFAYTWAFDRVFGLPSSARARPAPRAAAVDD